MLLKICRSDKAVNSPLSANLRIGRFGWFALFGTGMLRTRAALALLGGLQAIFEYPKSELTTIVRVVKVSTA